MEADREKFVEEIKTQAEDLFKTETIKNIIEHNEVIFDYKGEKYKVRKSTYAERQDIYKKRCEKQLELLKERNLDNSFKYLLEKDLKVLYKERGIDIDDINYQIRILQTQEKEKMMKLGEALKDSQPDTELQVYKNDIETIRNQTLSLALEKANLMDISLENQVLSFIYLYFAFLVTEKHIQEKDLWIKAWNSFNEFEKSDESLIATAASYATLLFNETS